MSTKTSAREEMIAKYQKQIKQLRVSLHKLEYEKEREEVLPLVGNCYRYENSYGGDNKWLEYCRIISIDKDTNQLICLMFAERPNGEILVGIEESWMPQTLQSLCCTKISQKLFERAWTNLVAKINHTDRLVFWGGKKK